MFVAVDRRVASLDGLRGVAILLVVWVHATVSPSADVPSLLLEFGQSAGWLGVDLFFVLSGFLLTRILLRARGQPRVIRNFYARRILRIWPLHFAVLAFAFLVAPHLALLRIAGLREQPLLWFAFLQNVPLAVGGVTKTSFDMLWSVAVEEQIYLVLPFLALKIAPNRLQWLLGTSLLMALGLRVVTVAGAGTAPLYYLTPMRMDAFAVGGLIAVLMDSGQIVRVARWAWPLLCVSVRSYCRWALLSTASPARP
jgi:peptidoglycan/LPS O-acetylase OafA/YrhL